MKFRLYENIYDGENNNKINKKKYKKHSMSPFVSLNAGDVQRGIDMFNHAMGSDTSSTADASVSVMGESIPDEFMMESELNEDAFENEKHCVITPDNMRCSFDATTAKISNQMNYIPKYLFKNKEYLQKVTIPNSVTDIRYGAFYGCTSLRSINLPNSIENIESYAFADSGLESIKIPDSVKHIGDKAFESCHQLRTVEIPASARFGDFVFSDCPSIRVVRTAPGSEAYYYFKNRYPNVEIRYIGEFANTQIVEIPRVVDDAYDELQQISVKLTLWASQKYIDDDFIKNTLEPWLVNTLEFTPFGKSQNGQQSYLKDYDNYYDTTMYIDLTDEWINGKCDAPKCSIEYTKDGNKHEIKVSGYDESNDNITYVVANESLTEDAYGNDKTYYLKGFNPLPNANNEYTIAKVSNSIDEVYDRAFDGFTALQKVTIPNSIKVIGRLAFGSCSSLRTINLPNSVKILKDYAFYASGLESIKIPDSVEYIGVGCFTNCEDLRMRSEERRVG